MVIANIMKPHHIKDLIQIEGGGESPHPQDLVSSEKEERRRRYHRHSVRDRELDPVFRAPSGSTSSSSGSGVGIIAGQDIPAYVIDRPVQVMPRLEQDLLSRRAGDETTNHSSIRILYVSGRLETDSGDGLSDVVHSLRSARDRHEQNVELIRDREHPEVFCVRTIKPLMRGQPFLVWYGEALARELGVPILTPANIRGNQEYICTLCQSTFIQPNILKAHLSLECGPSTRARRAQSTLVPFHALLENISARFISSSAVSDSRVNAKAESNQGKQCGPTEPIVVDTSPVIKCESVNVDSTLSSGGGQESPKHHTSRREHSNERHYSTMECSQSDLSPSLSSSSLDSSFLDENDEEDSTINIPITEKRSSSIHHGGNSAFHRPIQSKKRRTTMEDTSQVPDSSTDQRSALNLSVKEDHYSFLRNSFHHKNVLTQKLAHSWANPRAPIHPHHIGVYPINYSALPVCYPVVSNNAPSTSFNYMSYYNQHQHLSRSLNVRRDCFESQNMQNTEIPTLSDQQSPKRDHIIPTVPFTNPETCSSIDDSVAPMNPYGLNLPSDKEPLDLLPQTYFTNKSKRGHLCLYCGKLYSRKYGLKIHMRTHNGYKPLKCKICSRPFGDPSNLNKHVRLHAQGETPYRCDYCGKVLVRRRDLERHVRSRHPMGTVTIDTSSPPSSPISVEDIDTSSFQEPVSSL